MGKNAYFRLDISDTNVMLQIIPPEDGGRKLERCPSGENLRRGSAENRATQ